MSGDDWWGVVFWSSPVVSGLVSSLLAYRGMERLSALTLAVVAGLAFVQVANVFVGDPREWLLVLVVSVPCGVFLLGAAYAGHYVGQIVRQAER